jgi:ribosomal protein L12E/L44/L45/RPP1/RPP2|tara:strand:+ start:243 stop:413 length:171 start_codon:yes stop_codon:yes gene_type:complete
MKIYEILGENFAGAFASVPMALGGGDPKASIYANKPKKSKKKNEKTEETKHIMIKR